jgi:hypothetical protein
MDEEPNVSAALAERMTEEQRALLITPKRRPL